MSATATRSFYVPHPRVTEDNLELNPVTGELVEVPSMTKQSHKAECDINTILKQYRVTGQIAHISAKARQGAYEDLPDPVEFQDAMNAVIAAEESFATLPSRVRDRFGNDPAEFLVFMADPANKDEIAQMGLTKPKPAPEPPTPSPTPENAPAG